MTTPRLSKHEAARARELALRTADAYSWDNYGTTRWAACARLLVARGYTDLEVEAILRSKWTRWAGDMASGRPGWKYGRTTADDLARFLDEMPEPKRAREVASLVAGTFPGGLSDGEPADV